MDYNYGFKSTGVALDAKTLKEIEAKEKRRIEKWSKMLPDLKKKVPKRNDNCILPNDTH